MSDPADSRSWLPWRWPGWFCRLLLLMLVLLAVAAAFTVRAWCLSHVPDVAEPFDVNRFYPGDLPPKQNAFTHYLEARSRMISVTNDWSRKRHEELMTFRRDFPRVFAEGLSSLNEIELAWLSDCRPALDEWRRGTELTAAQSFTLAQLSGPISLTVHGNAHEFITMARIEAMRCEAEGDLNGAWEWCRACVRFTRHLNEDAGAAQRSYGCYAHQPTTSAIARWAEHPAVTTDQLRTALAEVRTEYAKNDPMSDVLKWGYLHSRQELGSSTWAEKANGIWPKWTTKAAVLRRPLLWVIGEPEVYMRLKRQVLVNQLNEIDKPLGDRPKLVGQSQFLFASDPNVELQPGQLTPSQIEQAYQQSVLGLIIGKVTFSIKHLDDAVWNERARQAALEVLLAAQAYRRDKGEFPENIKALVPKYLEAVPLDPCDRNGGRLRYRRDSPMQAVVWSIGSDGNDDRGEVEGDAGRSADIGFLLKVAEPK